MLEYLAALIIYQGLLADFMLRRPAAYKYVSDYPDYRIYTYELYVTWV